MAVSCYRWFACCLATLVSLCSINPVRGELPPLLDRSLFFGDPSITDVQLSPTGEQISFIRPYRGVRNIYVKGVDEPFDDARAVTAETRPVTEYLWTIDGKRLLYSQDKFGDEDYHIYALDVSGEPDRRTKPPTPIDLTPIAGVRALIYSLPKDRPHIVVAGLNDRDPAFHDAYAINMATGQRTLLVNNTHQVASWYCDLEGNVGIGARRTTDGGTELLRVAGEKVTPLLRVGYEDTARPYRFHPDQQRFYLLTNRGVDFWRLMLFDPRNGDSTTVAADPEGRVDFGGAIFAEDTSELMATVFVDDRERMYPKTERFKIDLAILREHLPKGDLKIVSKTRDMRRFLVKVSSDVDPGSYYLYDRKSRQVKLLCRSRTDLPSKHLAEVKPVRYHARDGVEIRGYLTLPKGVVPKQLPTVVFPHGGPWGRDYWEYNAYAQFLANRGYAVFQPNYRGSMGYGKRFMNAGNRQWGTGVMQHDVTDGVAWLIRQGIADKKRIAIFGGSHGGYIALCGVAFTPDVYACAIAYVAPSNLVTLTESVPTYFRPYLNMWRRCVGDPANPEDRKDLIARSPLFKAHQITAPLLVVHGANDPRVKQAESDQMVKALRDRGHDVEYLVAADEGHGFRHPENRIALAVAMERFLSKHLGGRFQSDVPQAVLARLKKITLDIDKLE